MPIPVHYPHLGNSYKYDYSRFVNGFAERRLRVTKSTFWSPSRNHYIFRNLIICFPCGHRHGSFHRDDALRDLPDGMSSEPELQKCLH